MSGPKFSTVGRWLKRLLIGYAIIGAVVAVSVALLMGNNVAEKPLFVVLAFVAWPYVIVFMIAGKSGEV